MRKFHNVLLVIEPGIDNQVAIDRAFELATANNADLSLISVVEEAPILRREAPDFLDALVVERTDELRLIATQWFGDASIHVMIGRPFLEIIRHVLQNDLDLVIKTKGESHSRFRALGGTDMHLLRKCPCPVWVVRPERGASCSRILAAVDIGAEDEEGSALARRVLEIATSLANAESSELDVLHAWSLAYESTLRSSRSGMPQASVDQLVANEQRTRTEKLETLTDDVVAAGPESEENCAAPHLLVKWGHPSDLIPELVSESDIDLIVMGTVGRTGIPGFFIGNTAEEVLAQIDCSVLAIKPPGFESPVTLS